MSVTSELKRFELIDAERIAVTGRWYGVRGRRFVRPSLTVSGARGGRRSLALLDRPLAALGLI